MDNQTILPFGSRTFIMGIINLTPDSFSGDGLIGEEKYIETAARQAQCFVDEGADILDLGAESTRPGAEMVDAESELDRLLPALQGILELKLDALISIDTYKAAVAERCLTLGANIINDVWGLKRDPELASVVAQFSAQVVLMHNRSLKEAVQKTKTLGGRYVDMNYQDLISEICNDLQGSIDIAKQAGIPDQHIIIDPGIGFGKTSEQNLHIIKNLMEFRKLGYPILLGPSRKSFIGYTLDLPPEERTEGTAAAVAIGINNGADIIRVHDVKEMCRVARMCDAILRS
ncbi:MAG: dihydropteroate synthase [Chloroflexi bacterium]|nr:dihydropteroate synthase [Chloroflexota bacterium]